MSADKTKGTEREILTALLDKGAVNFEAIATVLAQYGPSAALSMDGEDVFCGTMRRYVRVLRLAEVQVQLQDLATITEVGRELGR